MNATTTYQMPADLDAATDLVETMVMTRFAGITRLDWSRAMAGVSCSTDLDARCRRQYGKRYGLMSGDEQDLLDHCQAALAVTTSHYDAHHPDRPGAGVQDADQRWDRLWAYLSN